MKLTGTNSSIGLIVLIDHAHLRTNTACLSDQANAKRLLGPRKGKAFVGLVRKTCKKEVILYQLLTEPTASRFNIALS